MSTKCPYCNIDVSEALIEAEDGCCPECGALISAPSLGMGDELDDAMDYEDDDIFGDLDDDDEFERDGDFDDDMYEDDLDDEEFADDLDDEDLDDEEF